MQRFLHTNQVGASASVLSATASQPGFPVSWVRDQLRSKGWRSPVGWAIVAGFNDRLDFTEAGTARVATITASPYSTGANMATAVQTAMNAAPGAVNTYTVTHSGSTKLFTIARATGSAALVLKFAAGAANYARSVHPDIGFLNSDKSGSTSYDSDIVVWQSRHAVFADMGTAVDAFAGAAISPNASAIVTLQGGSSTLVGVGAATTGAPVLFSQQLGGGGNAFVGFFSEQSFRYWRLLLDDRLNTLGYTEVGVWYVGSYSEPSVCYSNDFTKRFAQLSTLEYAKGGPHYHDEQAQRRVYSMVWAEVPEADRVLFDAIAAACPAGKNFFLTLDIAAPSSSTVYGFLVADMEQRFVPGSYWTVPIEFAEALA